MSSNGDLMTKTRYSSTFTKEGRMFHLTWDFQIACASLDGVQVPLDELNARAGISVDIPGENGSVTTWVDLVSGEKVHYTCTDRVL